MFKRMNIKYLLISFICLVIAIFAVMSSLSPTTKSKRINILSWDSYIPLSLISGFEKKNNINITYDVFDSNEVLHAQLVAKLSGSAQTAEYDIVFPSNDYLKKQLKLRNAEGKKIYLPIKKEKIANYNNIDKEFLEKISKNYDTDENNNLYAIPYLINTTGMGYNYNLVTKILGKDAPLDSWDLVFNEKYISKLDKAGCKIGMIDAATEIIPIILNYLHKDPDDVDALGEAENLLSKIRPYVTRFSSSGYIQELVNGELCIVVGWSGDIRAARQQALANKSDTDNIDIRFIDPKEGALLSYDVLAIPQNSKNEEEAYKLINFLLDAKVMTEISKSTFFTNPLNAKYLSKELDVNDGFYCKTLKAQDLKENKIQYGSCVHTIDQIMQGLKEGRYFLIHSKQNSAEKIEQNVRKMNNVWQKIKSKSEGNQEYN